MLLGAFEGLLLGVAASILVRQYARSGGGHGVASRCNQCSASATCLELLPFGSVVVSRNRCRACPGSLSFFDPIIELGCGALCALVAVRVSSIWEVPAFSALIAGLMVLSAIDLHCRRLPTRIVYVTGLVTGLLLVGAAAALGEWSDLGRSLIGAVAVFGGFATLSLIYPKGLGFGDVRLAALCGGILGWVGYPSIITGLLIGCGVGTVAALVSRSRGNGRSSIAFGPCLAVGTVAAVVLGASFVA